jgi:Flp pilus assembly protein TadD
MNLRDQPGADRDFDTALQMDQNEPEAWLNKGLLRLRQNRAADAMPLIERAMEAHTIRPALALYARGVANEQLGHLKAAYSDLSQARDMAPGWKLPAEQLARYQVR